MNDALETMHDIKQAEIRERADSIWRGMKHDAAAYHFADRFSFDHECDALECFADIFLTAALHRDDEAELGRRVLQILDRIVVEEATN